MKKFLGLLGLVIFTAIFSATVTYLVVSNRYSERRARELDNYDKQLDKLEAQVKQLEASLHENPPQPVPIISGGGPSQNPWWSDGSGLPTPTGNIGLGPGSVPLPPGWNVAAAAPAAGAARIRYDAASSGSKCRIEGTSSIHDWKMETQIIGGFFEMDGQVNLDPAQGTPGGVGEDGRIAAVAEVTIPVRSLKSYSTAMDEVYQEHMEAIRYRKIEYRLKELVLKKVTHAQNTPFEFDSQGELIVHGVTNLVSMPVKIERPDSTSLKISGVTPLKMSDYKVQPPCPTIANVKITTGDEITMTFQWVVTRAESKVTIVPKTNVSSAQ